MSLSLKMFHDRLLFVPSKCAATYYVLTRDKESQSTLPRMRMFMYRSLARKKLLKEAVVTEKVEVMPTIVFVGHGYVQQAGSKCREKHCT